VVISQEGRAYRERVRALLASDEAHGNGPRKPPSGGRIALDMNAFPPDRRRRDLDNIQKAILDSLEHGGVYEDDSQIDLLITRRREVNKRGRIDIQMDEFPLTRCPLCHGPWHPDNN
jgi:crossover junction endodeoxyribonuclease RusA